MIEKHAIFTDSIIMSEIIDKNFNNKILKTFKENNKKSNIRSSRFGFQTQDIDNSNINNIIIKKCLEYLKHSYKPLKNNLKIILNNLWINKNTKGSYNVPHQHPNSNFSGVFYVSVTKDCGELVFLRNDKSTAFLENSKFFQSHDFYTTFTIKPKNNLFILFPSNLEHLVNLNYSNEPRISISFNISLKYV